MLDLDHPRLDRVARDVLRPEALHVAEPQCLRDERVEHFPPVIVLGLLGSGEEADLHHLSDLADRQYLPVHHRGDAVDRHGRGGHGGEDQESQQRGQSAHRAALILRPGT